MYPAAADWWNNYQQSLLITNYEKVVEELEQEDFTEEWEKAQSYNCTIEKNDLYAEVFEPADSEMLESDYWKALNVAGDGIMGYIEIPKIGVELAIYHGTSETVLQKGVGHLNGTSLPIGGENSHSVLTSHRGLPSAKLFTDIDQLEKGDMFYISILDEVLAYQVDQVLDMVEMDDKETLGEALAISEGEDFVTLFTCTPYGVNSHRLLVRGTRVPYEGKETVNVASDGMVKVVQDNETPYVIAGLAITLLVIFIIRMIRNRRRIKK